MIKSIVGASSARGFASDALTRNSSIMHAVVAILGATLVAFVISDAFQTVVVARHAHRPPLLTRIFYASTWPAFLAGCRCLRTEQLREKFLGVYGPLSLLLLLNVWACCLILGFALLQWAVSHRWGGSSSGFLDYFYFSAATFFTLGSGEPLNVPSKFLMVLEAGSGFSFLGLVIGYLPVLYQASADRELRILLLDARAGSPPTAAQFLQRGGADPAKLVQRLEEWEKWALDLLQNHLSYPMLAFYRSQHPNQSWLAALTVVVDVSAVLMACAEGELKRQAGFTFAAGRHSLVHTASIFHIPPRAPRPDRLPGTEFPRLSQAIASASSALRTDSDTEERLAELRSMYEPYAAALGKYFHMVLPAWESGGHAPDNWQISTWNG